jgi:hypothetical protein
MPTPPALAPASSGPSSSRRRSWARFVLVFAIVTGLVGAVGVVLIILSTRQRGVTPPPTTAADAAPSAAAAKQPSGDVPPAASSAPALLAAPPSTGTTGRATTPGPTAPVLPGTSSRKDGGASRSSGTASPPADVPPNHL